MTQMPLNCLPGCRERGHAQRVHLPRHRGRHGYGHRQRRVPPRIRGHRQGLTSLFPFIERILYRKNFQSLVIIKTRKVH